MTLRGDSGVSEEQAGSLIYNLLKKATVSPDLADVQMYVIENMYTHTRMDGWMDG